MTTHAKASSGSRTTWITPLEVVDVARSIMGGIDLDACTTEENAAYHGIETFFTRKHDGLARPWPPGLRVWLNPPYGRDIADWMGKASAYCEDDGGTCIALVPPNVDTAWFRCCHRWPLAFWRGRVRFHVSPGVPGESPTQGNTLVLMGRIDIGRATDVLRGIADVWVPMHAFELRRAS